MKTQERTQQRPRPAAVVFGSSAFDTEAGRCRLARVAFLSCFLACTPSFAELTDATQTTPQVAGGAIQKSLTQQIGAGHGDELTAESAVYLIKRDPARSIRRGRQLFQRKFTLEQGQGPRVSRDSSGDIQENPALGAGLADSCSACHGRPRGAAGSGGDVATRPDSRDAPHLFGLGLVEMLADEITGELREIRKQAIDRAVLSAYPVTLPLIGKGIRYGLIRGLPNGGVDTSLVLGVDPDLRVRPFFAQGGEFSMRAFIVGAFKDEMGLESADPVLCGVTDSSQAIATTTPSGLVLDPRLDKIKRPPLCSRTVDGDGDGVVNEIDAAVIDHMEFYLLNYFKPGTGRAGDRAREGRQLMAMIGCTSCHVQDLRIERDRRVADVETRFDPLRGIFNRLFGTATTLFDAVNDGQAFPKLVPKGQAFLVRNIFTDFKRHDLGPAFHERNYDGTLLTQVITEPLWGVATTAPYGHDGRSINIEEVILRHGGEAQASRTYFVRLSESNRRRILEFLSTLVLFPPDDTASTLNPGLPGSEDLQDPAEHGSINLGALFQTPGGAE
jgi:Di-haem oxidoreductase, putative peroxidase